MNYLKFVVCLLCTLMLTISAQAAQRNLAVTRTGDQEQKRVALVIGNAAYQGTSPLRNPVNDAHAMSDALNKLGFQVIEVTDASQKEMNRAIADFGSKLNADTAALFFYAGHGLQVKNKNYLVPVDAQINGEAGVRAETVDVDTVMDQLNVSSLSIVILDACRNNPFERSFRKMGGGLAQMDAPKGSFIAYATAPGKTAADGDGKNGLFTQELLKQINSPGLSLEGVFKRVRANVSKSTGDAQMPWDSSSMTGDFYFKPGDGTQVASLVPVAVPTQPLAHIKTRDEIEQDSWGSVQGSGNIASVQEYLKQYPKGRFAGQARILIANLKGGASRPVEPVAINSGRSDAESDLWGEVQKGNSIEDYRAYLSQYPKGKYAVLAKGRLTKFETEAADVARAQRDAQAQQQAQQEQSAWESANSSASEASYQSYLNQYPKGKYSALASGRITKLRNEAAQAQQQQGAERQRQQAEAAVAASKGPAMVRIPGGNTQIGSSKDTDNPVRRVSVQAFEMGKYAVTQKEWRDVMGSNPSKFTSCGDNCPVEQVSWDDIQIFLQKLNAKTGRQYRLPNETEWEYACYGGSQTEYCGGNDIDSVAWYGNNGSPGGNSNQTPHPVGQKQANGYGLYDMSGNVWQWMENKYDNEHDWRAVRGGSWGNVPQFVRAAYRNGDVAANRNDFFGFRLARTLP